MAGGVFERDVVRDDVLVEVGEDGLGLGGFEVEQEMVVLGEDGGVRLDRPWAFRREGVAALATDSDCWIWFVSHGVQEALAVLAKNLDAAAVGGSKISVLMRCRMARRAAEMTMTRMPETGQAL